jgi:hypothetical protein
MAHRTQDVSSLLIILSATLTVTAIQAGLAAVQQDEGLGVALAAHGGAGREGAGRFIG